MVKQIRQKWDKAYATGTKVLKHLEEILTAVSLSIVTGFSAYQSYLNVRNGWEWVALGVASAYLATEAFRAWYRALNK